MSTILAFPYEDALEPGSAVVAGASGAVALPGADGTGVFAGVYSHEGNVSKERPNSNDTAGITIHGPCKVKVKGAVLAFEFGQLADANGALEALEDPPAGLPIKVPGFFLEDGADGEIVDFFINPFVIPTPTETDATAAAALAAHIAAEDPHAQYALESAMTTALAAKADLVDGKVPANQLPA
ncbi:MAG TPA: hypothetical protein VN445_09070 [Rectinemataceae bacterium]|nr:hypothetical protein [Rectinemataceae bacterium]